MRENYLLETKLNLESVYQVRSILYLFDRGIKFAYSSELNNHKYILGVYQYEDISKIIQAFENVDKMVISKIRELQIDEISYVSYKFVYEMGKSFEVIIVEQEKLLDILYRFRNFEILLDKDKFVKKYDKDSINTIFWSRPDELEFEQSSKEFFLKLINITLYHKDKDFIRSNLLFDDIIDDLIDVINTHIAVKYDNNIYLDVYGTNLKRYLDNDYYDELEYILNLDRKNDLWTGIFKSARLYRSIALEICNKLKYEYIKQEDVDVMKYLRDVYDKEN